MPNSMPRPFHFIQLILLLCFLASIGRAADNKVDRPIRKILFLGNSITRHGPKPSIGWTTDWGMAASARDKDFVHLVTDSIFKTMGTSPQVMIKTLSGFERQYATYDLDKELKEASQFRADLIVVAIGENVSRLDSEKSKTLFTDSFGKLLRHLKADNNPTLVVRSCFWGNPVKDKILRQGCQEVGGIFVDIRKLGKDESNYARSERKFTHKGVAAHPGDKGMQAIANAILAAIKQGHPTAKKTGQ
jgi:lysophospholipase L1-like esterase